MWDEDEEYGNAKEVLQGTKKMFVMSLKLCNIAYEYVLTNVAIMEDL